MSEQKSMNEQILKIVGIALLVGIFITTSSIASSLQKLKVVSPSDQAIADASRLDKWLQTGTNITIQNVTNDRFNEIWQNYICSDVHVNICLSAFEFSIFGFNYDGISPLTIYRSGVNFLTQNINGSAYEIQFGRVVGW